jgi:hypothetical protein
MHAHINNVLYINTQSTIIIIICATVERYIQYLIENNASLAIYELTSFIKYNNMQYALCTNVYIYVQKTYEK